MHKLNQKSLNQMIEKAISFKQENSSFTLLLWISKFKKLFSKKTTPLIILCSALFFGALFLPNSKSLYVDDSEEIYHIVMLEIIDNF